jgi:uncharacterized protein YecE (DUF72 family)
MTLHLGTSGWQYKDWRGRFYPQELPQARWLAHYAREFATVEINNSFYRLPSRETFAKWAAGVPERFVFCPKISRYLSHMKKLKEPAEPVERFMEAARGLGAKFGPALLQLPGNFKAQPERLAETLALFPADVRVAVELRHESWFTDEVRGLLERHNAALVWADRLEKPVAPLWRTADWAYIRWHEGSADPWPCYRPEALTEWVERLRSTWTDREDVWAFFNNDPGGCAITDARVFAEAWAGAPVRR